MKRKIIKVAQQRNNNKGFSIVELMVVLGIFSFVLGAVYMSMSVGQSSWQISQTQIRLQEELRKGMDFMMYELREAAASNIDISEDGKSIQFFLPASVSSTGSIVWDSDDPVTITLGEGNTLVRTSNSGTRTLSQNISDVDFSIEDDVLTIDLSAQIESQVGQSIDKELSFEVFLRN